MNNADTEILMPKRIRKRFNMPNKQKIIKLIWAIFHRVLVTGICFIILYPLFSKLSISFMMEEDLFDPTVSYIPRILTLDNYFVVWKETLYLESLSHSFLLALTVSLLQVAVCTTVGYGFARFDFRGKTFFFGLVILAMVVPSQLIYVPLYLQYRYFDFFGLLPLLTGISSINLLDSLYPYIFLSITAMGLKNGLYIYMTRQFFRGMPKELEEAAYIDGAGTFRTYASVMLPGAVPIMVTIILFSFVWQWNDIFYASLFLNEFNVLPTKLLGLGQSIIGRGLAQGTDLNYAYASMLDNTAIIMMIVPLIILYIFGQRYFTESIERSGIVG